MAPQCPRSRDLKLKLGIYVVVILSVPRIYVIYWILKSLTAAVVSRVAGRSAAAVISRFRFRFAHVWIPAPFPLQAVYIRTRR